MATYPSNCPAKPDPLSLFASHTELAHRIVGHMFNSHQAHDQDDARQVALIALHRAAVEWDPCHPSGTPFPTFARTRMGGALATYRRSIRRHRHVSYGDVGFEPACLSALGSATEVQEALPKSLNPRLRAALVLYYVDGMDYAEVGEALGVTPIRAAYLIRKGREECRLSLSAQAQ